MDSFYLIGWFFCLVWCFYISSEIKFLNKQVKSNLLLNSAPIYSQGVDVIFLNKKNYTIWSVQYSYSTIEKDSNDIYWVRFKYVLKHPTEKETTIEAYEDELISVMNK